MIARTHSCRIWMLLTLLFAQATTADTADHAELIEINRKVLTQVLVDNDGSAFREYALENFLVVAPGGRVENREQAIAGIDSLQVKSVDISDEQVTAYGDTAVLVGKLVADGTMQPLGALPPMKFMTTFVRTADGWRMLSRALTVCAPIAVERGVC